MKQLLTLLATAFVVQASFAQIAINNTNATPDSSAMLDVSSTTKGLLIPRLTSSQIAAFFRPAPGLLVYQTDGAPGFYYNTGTKNLPQWVQLSSSLSAWSTTGNNSTTAASFIGTTDNQPLRFRVFNFPAGMVSTGTNTAFGFRSFLSGTTGTNNSGFGYNSLNATTTGSDNTALGMYALTLNTTGYSNSAAGSNSMYYNTTGTENTAFGTSALFWNSTGHYNTAVGVNALFNNTESYNTAAGYRALQNNTSGYQNTALGALALTSTTTGTFNTAAGTFSMNNNTTGFRNAAFGVEALMGITTGFYNTAVGSKAIQGNTTGYGNTGVGYLTLWSNVTGAYNTAVGYGANVGTTNLNNATAIGYEATVNASNKVRIGNTQVTVIEGQVAYSFPSDARFKSNIKTNVPGLDFITKLTPVTYYFNERMLAEYNKTGILDSSMAYHASYHSGKQLHTGFLAQDVEKIANELGYSFDGVHAPANSKDHYSLAYSQFIMPLVKAVQEQQAMIEQLKNEKANQATEINEMKARLQKLEKLLPNK